jgi:hypothetical protein
MFKRLLVIVNTLFSNASCFIVKFFFLFCLWGFREKNGVKSYLTAPRIDLLFNSNISFSCCHLRIYSLWANPEDDWDKHLLVTRFSKRPPKPDPPPKEPEQPPPAISPGPADEGEVDGASKGDGQSVAVEGNVKENGSGPKPSDGDGGEAHVDDDDDFNDGMFGGGAPMDDHFDDDDGLEGCDK